jgi:uncharacterized protein YbbC (DUF1343 family)/CubicO group peptidase (beta-lactamase class C family)
MRGDGDPMATNARRPAALVAIVLLCSRAVAAFALEAPSALEGIAPIVEAEIRAGAAPGAVVLVGHAGQVVYRRAFGERVVEPAREPMRPDTVFDLASLTKVVATTTAVMQLVELGKLDLDSRAARYWPAFAARGKAPITVRQLLTHSSGLAPDLDLGGRWSGYRAAMRRIVAERPIHAPGTRALYSDVNFEVLGELVRRVSGSSLETYCSANVFGPLGMNDTTFRPSGNALARAAPTERIDGVLRWGMVHDPTAYRMGGVAGHAGLFSTADDLARFAQMILDGGSRDGRRILRPQTVRQMTELAPRGGTSRRGLGWSAAPEILGPSAFGHLGYTGTSLWIDPRTRTYVIILTNRVHPAGRGDVRALREQVADAVARSYGEDRESIEDRAPGVRTGIDVLRDADFAPLAGRRVGLITNSSAVDSAGRRTIDLFRAARAVRLVALFSPEHGLDARHAGRVASFREPSLGIPVYSLYGEVLRPTPAMLEGIDALVFDVPDAGARFFTYATTMAYAMEAAARSRVPFWVLDRPNPITADRVQGPVLRADLRSFTGYAPLPVRHGMTIGELARLFNAEDSIGADLHVVAMDRYRRSDWFDETRLPWTRPSPNLRSLTAATLYPGVALVEGANVSVGRGTDTPFELVGAPWVDGPRLAAFLNGRRIRGVRFEAAEFEPRGDRFARRRCSGVRIALLDRSELDPPALGVELAGALYKQRPDRFRLDGTLGMIGDPAVVSALRAGGDPRRIAGDWQGDVERFLVTRSRYLLY